MRHISERIAEQYELTGGNVSAVARAIGTTRTTVRYYMRKLGLDKNSKPLRGGKVQSFALPAEPLPERGRIRRYLLTSLQNNTEVHAKAWENLLALKRFYNAKLMVSRFTYNKNAYGRMSTKPGTQHAIDADLWYDPKVEAFVSDTDVEIAPGLVWCGRQNTLPTADKPLSGFESYHGRKSTVIPHVKIAVQSVPSAKHEPVKFMYTTGTVGKINYVQKRAGIKAEHHHCYGALLVEVDDKGRWWCRQLNADRKGRIFDLGITAEDGEISRAANVESITWGDVHLEEVDPLVRKLAWSKGGILDTLRPSSQILHDLVDPPRSHHNMRDPHKLFEQYVHGRESMADMCDRIVAFLNEESARPWCKTVVANSNHDNMVDRWLREADYRQDPINALFFLETQLAKYTAISKKDSDFHTVEHAMCLRGCSARVRWLREDESFIICKDSNGGIEAGSHGHLGPNGARGSAANLAKMARRMNRGHDHTAGAVDGVYTAGTSSLLDLGYNRGPSSWSHTFIVTFKNGKRQLITIFGGKWRAAA